MFVQALELSSLNDKERLLIRTIAHELGHVFNLAHEDALQQNRQILFDPASLDGITTPSISDDCWEHLLRHDADSVRPGSGIIFGGRRCNSFTRRRTSAASSRARAPEPPALFASSTPLQAPCIPTPADRRSSSVSRSI